LLRQGQTLDAHGVAETLVVLCPGAPEAATWRFVDAIALLRLDEPARAQLILAEIAASGPPELGTRALTVRAWTALRARDYQAAATLVPRLPPDTAARLELLARADDPPAFRMAFGAGAAPLARAAEIAAAEQAYTRARRTKRPWLAATLSTLLPGAGQAYAGSWQAAAVALTLNGVLIGATTELALHRFYFSASAAGVAASIFYLGNIVNAADLARRRNELAAEPARDALDHLLVPEAFPETWP
jgi:hypothetical protein